MYASLSITIPIPEKRDEFIKVVEQRLIGLLKETKGFKNAVLFSDEERNEYGSLILWETKEDCDAYVKSMREGGAKLTSPLTAGMLFRPRTFYVNYSF